MKTRYTVALSMIAGAAALVAFTSGSVVAQPMEKKGTTPYVTHFIFRPLMSIDIPGLGTATNLEAVGTTQNMKGEKMLDKMSARCAALSVASGDCMSSEHFGQLAWQFKRMSGSSGLKVQAAIAC